MWAAEDGVSSIQAFTPTVAESAQEASHISSLDCVPPAQHIIPPQEVPSTISEYSTKSVPKPRPRPIFNQPNTNPIANTSTSDPILPYTPASDHREQATALTRSDPTGLESTSGNTTFAPIDFSQDIAERAKMRTRKATKRSTQYTEDIIDITDDELTISPTRRPKERPKPRPVKRAIPNRDHPPLPSDPITIPVPSSSLSLPPSDPFPDSTVINPTPPPPGLDEIAAFASPTESPSRKRKRERPGRIQSPIDGPTHLPPLPTAPARASSPRSSPKPPVREPSTTPDLNRDVESNAKGSDDERGTEATKRHKNSKGTEDSNPRRSAFGKTKKKPIVEVVILSPKKKNKRTEASGDNSKPRKGTRSRNKRLVSSDQDEDDELLLAPQSNSPAVAKSRKGKKRETKLRFEDKLSTEVASSSGGIMMDEEQDEHQQGAAAPTSHIDERGQATSRSDELTTATPLKVDPNHPFSDSRL
jgi:hypothetical protein